MNVKIPKTNSKIEKHSRIIKNAQLTQPIFVISKIHLMLISLLTFRISVVKTYDDVLLTSVLYL